MLWYNFLSSLYILYELNLYVYVVMFLLYIEYIGIWFKLKFKMLISKLVWISLRKLNYKFLKENIGF